MAAMATASSARAASFRIPIIVTGTSNVWMGLRIKRIASLGLFSLLPTIHVWSPMELALVLNSSEMVESYHFYVSDLVYLGFEGTAGEYYSAHDVGRGSV